MKISKTVSVNSVAACVLATSAPFALPAHAQSGAQASARIFEKNASQFCVSRLSAEQQGEVFSRIMNLGASYSHGCTQCDAGKAMRDQVIAAGEFNFTRRNFLAQFLHRGNWKNPQEFKFEYMTVLENDVFSNLAQIYDKKELKRTGYDGKWSFYPDLDRMGRLSVEQEAYAKSSPGYVDESALVGNGFVRRDLKKRDLTRRGHIYQTVPGQFAAQGAKQKKIFDLAFDSARSFEIMKAYGNTELFKKLEKQGWRDAALREQLVNSTVEYLRSFDPSIVFSVDSLFWDAVPHMFHYARLEKPNSLMAKLITMPAVSKLLGLDFYDDVQRENMIADYYKVLERLSAGDAKRRPVPIMLGRLIDAPGETIKARGLESEFGMLIGLFVSVFTGRDFTAEVTEQLKKLSYEVPNPNTLGVMGLPVSESGLTSSEIDLVKLALARAQEVEDSYYQKEFGIEKASEMKRVSTQNEQKPVLPWIVRGAVNAAILNALGDLPLLIKSADRAFTTQNRYAREVAARQTNNVQLVNVDEFYLKFHQIVNPATMHPSVEGTREMADLVDRALCNSVGPTP